MVVRLMGNPLAGIELETTDTPWASGRLTLGDADWGLYVPVQRDLATGIVVAEIRATAPRRAVGNRPAPSVGATGAWAPTSVQRMGNTTWAVEYPVDPSASPTPVGAKLLATLEAALRDAPLDEWAYEVDGEPVEDFQEFKKRIDAAAGAREGQFVARANGITVRSV
ncbi:hypothetical protein [Streptomyces misionensis]|uniref:hypothetical protein n=1 Tax=Streptomyces misionensis TaxID=67331 RepID=UPI0033B6CE1C